MITKISDFLDNMSTEVENREFFQAICKSEGLEEEVIPILASEAYLLDENRMELSLDGQNWLFTYKDGTLTKVEVPYMDRYRLAPGRENEDHRGLGEYDPMWMIAQTMSITDCIVNDDSADICIPGHGLHTWDAIRIVSPINHPFDKDYVVRHVLDNDWITIQHNNNITKFLEALDEAKAIMLRRHRPRNIDFREAQYDGWEENIKDPSYQF
jgi:hypothetical protein